MLKPKVTLLTDGGTRSFVVRNKLVTFRAKVPKIVSWELAERVRKMKQANGKPLFSVSEITARDKESDSVPKIISHGEIVNRQHVDGDDDWKQRSFISGS